jgi:hypothetical protein
MGRQLIGNRATEKDVRDYLTRHGFQGDTARFDYLDLFAIERPGWVQIFKFRVHVSDNTGERHRFFGVVRDDERSGLKIHFATDGDEQGRVAETWSKGLITGHREPLNAVQWSLIGVFGAGIALALLGALI